jgi:acetyltransferase-like isoleucine patch superfamily enzyme
MNLVIKIGRIIKLLFIKVFKSNIALGSNVTIDFQCKLYDNGNSIFIGNGVVLRGVKKGYHAALTFPTTILLDVKGGEILIGDHSRINGAYLHAKKKITIGQNVLIASGVNILDSNGHELVSLNRTQGKDKPEEILIGNNVWIGLNAIILKGTIIGDNSVVAAGSVVKGVFPQDSIIGGNPAVLMKKINFT